MAIEGLKTSPQAEQKLHNYRTELVNVGKMGENSIIEQTRIIEWRKK